MAWKKALFLGGAVLLLAACSDATAPSTPRNGSPAAADKANMVSTVAPLETLIDIGGETCRSGYYVRSGDRDLCIVSDIP
ncbi:MAG TPA: hypothetical protein VKH19_11525 [Gemmatimonadaceae bacterium]|nr:hypothetical protein [Gemmatimonadaceae bacterium]